MDDIPAPCGKFTIPAGTHWLRIWVYKPGGLPCAWVSGRGLDSGEGWLAGCHDGEFLPAGVVGMVRCSGQRSGEISLCV